MVVSEDGPPKLHQASVPTAVAQLRMLGGALACVAPDATAFAHPPTTDHCKRRRDVRVPRRGGGAPGLGDRTRARAAPGGVGGSRRVRSDEGEARVRDVYTGTARDRLKAIKRRYDPTNLFRLQLERPTQGSMSTTSLPRRSVNPHQGDAATFLEASEEAPESARCSNSRSLVAGGSHPPGPRRSALRPASRRRQGVTGHPLGSPANRLAADQGATAQASASRLGNAERGLSDILPAAAMSSREVRRSAWTSSSARPAEVVSHPPGEPPGALLAVDFYNGAGASAA
jgi:Berberine and berberine like